MEIVYGTGDEVVGFNLTPASGGMLELDVTKEKVMADDTKTNAICRTWKIESIREVEYEGGRKVYDETFTAGDPSGYGDDYPTEVLISKSGTYLVYYRTDTSASLRGSGRIRMPARSTIRGTTVGMTTSLPPSLSRARA